MWNQAVFWLILLVTHGTEFVISRCSETYQSLVDLLLSIFLLSLYTWMCHEPPMDMTYFGFNKDCSWKTDSSYVFFPSPWSSVSTEQWGERTFFHPKNARHLAAAHSQSHTAGDLLPYGVSRPPIVTQAGTWRNNFAVHESRGLGADPSNYYTDPNNVHQHVDLGAGLILFIHVHMFSTCVNSDVFLAAQSSEGTDTFPNQRGLKMKLNPIREEVKRKVSILSCTKVSPCLFFFFQTHMNLNLLSPCSPQSV